LGNFDSFNLVVAGVKGDLVEDEQHDGGVDRCRLLNTEPSASPKKNSPIGGADALPERMISRCIDE
jgi:hypothetical protein